MSMPPTFARDFRRTLLWIPRITFPVYLYGAVTLSSLGIPPEFELAGSGVPESEHHTATAFRRRLRFALYPLRSPLLRGCRLSQSPRSSEARLSMRWAYLILPLRSWRRSEGAVVPRYRHKPRARSLGCGNWRLPPNALVSIPVGPAGPADRFLRAAPEALADSVPDHRDVRQPARPLRRPHVREPLRQGVRIRDQPRADRRRDGVHRGAVRDRGPSPLEGGARLDLPRARPRFLRDSRVGPARSLLPESRPVFCLPLPLRRAPGGRLGLGPLVRRGACRLDRPGVLEIRPAWHAGVDEGLRERPLTTGFGIVAEAS